MKILGKDDTKISKELEGRIHRGRERLQSISSKRDEAYEFYRGNHYVYVDEKNVLQRLTTTTTVRGTGKPRWRARQTRNLILDVVLHAASQATARVPSYQVVPSTGDPDDQSAAKLSEKIALYGYHRWNIRKATVDAVIHAIVGGESFAWPFFDNTIGPFIQGEGVGQGDVRVRVFGGNECYWEPGLRFEDSPWHVVEHARPLDQVMAMDGYMGGGLTADAAQRALSSQGTGQSDKRKLVLVTEYLERPTPEKPKGRWVTMANQRRVIPDRPYPGSGQDPVLRRLSYAPDPDSDRDFGLVPQLLDSNRSLNDCVSKLTEWKNLCLLPRIAVTPGLMKRQRWTDEPGKVYEIPQPDQNFKVVETPAVPQELFEIAERAERDLARISGQNDIPPQVESGKAIAELLQRDAARFGMFITDLAEGWHSQVMHDCLSLVQKHYSEKRLIQIKGDFGWETIRDFQGSQLRDQVDVRVLPDSIEPRTKEAVEQRVMNYANLGWVSSQQAMTAIETGTAETVIRSLVQDEARAGRIIQRIREGADSLYSMPEMPTGRLQRVEQIGPDGQPVIDPMTGQPVMVDSGEPEYAPGWMPRHSDNLQVFRSTFEDFMKTEEYERLPPDMQQAAGEIYAGILLLENEKAAEAAAQQAAQAEQMGMGNAARPQGPPPLPSLPSANGNKTS